MNREACGSGYADALNVVRPCMPWKLIRKWSAHHANNVPSCFSEGYQSSQPQFCCVWDYHMELQHLRVCFLSWAQLAPMDIPLIGGRMKLSAYIGLNKKRSPGRYLHNTSIEHMSSGSGIWLAHTLHSRSLCGMLLLPERHIGYTQEGRETVTSRKCMRTWLQKSNELEF